MLPFRMAPGREDGQRQRGDYEPVRWQRHGLDPDARIVLWVGRTQAPPRAQLVRPCRGPIARRAGDGALA
jgi:hypothetical protein